MVSRKSFRYFFHVALVILLLNGRFIKAQQTFNGDLV